ncbi:MAG TPA: hypothetical protein PLS49_05190 [Candidatus Woesebacteria bacterium]|nr:hypothetical protein [Candidatus Woesebacteria bacterium]
MKTKIAMESLAMDLKRVALGYHRGSEKMAIRFSEEAIKRKKEIEYSEVKSYIQKLLNKIEIILKQKNKDQIAEDSLLMSILIQNYTQVFF